MYNGRSKGKCGKTVILLKRYNTFTVDSFVGRLKLPKNRAGVVVVVLYRERDHVFFFFLRFSLKNIDTLLLHTTSRNKGKKTFNTFHLLAKTFGTRSIIQKLSNVFTFMSAVSDEIERRCWNSVGPLLRKIMKLSLNDSSSNVLKMIEERWTP